MSSNLYILQTLGVKYQINTFWCQLDRRSCKQALLLFIETKCRGAWFSLHYFKKVFVDEAQVYSIPAPSSNKMYEGKR